MILLFCIGIIQAQEWSCPSGQSTIPNACCLTEANENPSRIPVTVSEDLVVGDVLKFGNLEILPLRYPAGADAMLDYSFIFNPVLEVLNDDETDICSTNAICSNDLFEVKISDADIRLSSLSLIDLKAMGGPQFKFGLICAYGAIQESYEILLEIVESDNTDTPNNFHHAPEIQLQSGAYTLDDGKRGSVTGFKTQSFDLIPTRTDGPGIIIEFRTEPPNYESFFEIDSDFNTIFKNVLPNEPKFEETKELRSVKPIYYEDVGLTGIAVIVKASSWISNPRRAVYSSEVSIPISILDQDNMPPLFCTNAEILSAGTCQNKIKSIEQKRTQIIQDGFLEFIQALDGDRGIDSSAILYELTSQLPDNELFYLSENGTGVDLKFGNIETNRLFNEVSIETTFIITARQSDNLQRYSSTTIVLKVVDDTILEIISNGDTSEIERIGIIESESGDNFELFLDIPSNYYSTYEILWSTLDDKFIIDKNGIVAFIGPFPDDAAEEEVVFKARILVENDIRTIVQKRIKFSISNSQVEANVNTRVPNTSNANLVLTTETDGSLSSLNIGLIVGMLCLLFILILFIAIVIYIRRYQSRGFTVTDGSFVSEPVKETLPIIDNINQSPVITPKVEHRSMITLESPEIHELVKSEVVVGGLIKTGVITQIRKAKLSTDESTELVSKISKISGLTASEKNSMLHQIVVNNMVKKLEHPNVLKQFGSYYHEGSIYTFAEFSEKGSLNELFEHYKEHHWERLKEMTTIRIQQIITGIAKGIQELHANAIVHGSIRSKNIMIDADFIPKLTNLKSAHAEDDRRWWAPELFKEGHLPTEQSDVWSFGIVMWELCTMGGLPYGHVKIVDLVSHLKVDRLPMTKNMPTELYALMSSSWQAESTSRPSAKQIIDQLNQSYIADIMKTPKEISGNKSVKKGLANIDF